MFFLAPFLINVHLLDVTREKNENLRLHWYSKSFKFFDRLDSYFCLQAVGIFNGVLLIILNRPRTWLFANIVHRLNFIKENK